MVLKKNAWAAKLTGYFKGGLRISMPKRLFRLYLRRPQLLAQDVETRLEHVVAEGLWLGQQYLDRQQSCGFSGKGCDLRGGGHLAAAFHWAPARRSNSAVSAA